ncbi:hypothetical protein MMC27_007739 [Xylographa pallens]|nr:hypothetical protein [Xylographa pallens]
MRPLRPLLHAHLLLLVSAFPPSYYTSTIPVCSATYGPADNDDTTEALRILGAPFSTSNFPLAQDNIPLPRYARFASVLVGFDILRMDPIAAGMHANGLKPAWNWHLRNLATLQSACVTFQGFEPHMRELGGWMQDHGFFYVVVNDLAAGDVEACLREPGMLFETCVARGVQHNWQIHQQVINLAQEAASAPAPAPMDADVDDVDGVDDLDVQAMADALLVGMY